MTQRVKKRLKGDQGPAGKHKQREPKTKSLVENRGNRGKPLFGSPHSGCLQGCGDRRERGIGFPDALS